MTPLARLRRPEYTGQNRCWPCTILNVAILAVAVVTVGVLRPLAGVAIGVAGTAFIWLRGYLVPYTPTLGPRVAAWLPGDLFDHGGAADNLGDLDPAADDGEAVLEALLEAGVVVVEGEQLGLADDFATAWRERMDDLAAGPDDALVDAATEVATDVDSARIEATGAETYFVVSGGGGTAWLRRPVAIAEVGAARALEGTDLPAVSRDLAAHALAAFLETCPSCDADLVEGPADDCCGHTVPVPGHEPPEVLACERCGVAFYTFEPVEDAPE